MFKRVIHGFLALAVLASALTLVPGCNPQRSQDAQAYRASMWHEANVDHPGPTWRAGHEGGLE